MTIATLQRGRILLKAGLHASAFFVICAGFLFANCGCQCLCAERFTTCSLNCQPLIDCADAYNKGYYDSGVYVIKPTNWPGCPFEVYCNMTDGGGWTVFQRRVDGSVNFYRDWSAYKNGFGSADHELWLGNDKLYYLTNQHSSQLRIDIVDRDGSPYYAKYDLFRINDETDFYRLADLGTYTGTVAQGSDYFRWHADHLFSTYDCDVDGWDEYNCAERHMSGWWHFEGYAGRFDSYACPRALCDMWPTEDNCGWCSYLNLNGVYKGSYGTSLHWNNKVGHECNLTYTEMKIKPL